MRGNVWHYINPQCFTDNIRIMFVVRTNLCHYKRESGNKRVTTNPINNMSKNSLLQNIYFGKHYFTLNHDGTNRDFNVNI